MYIYHHCLYWWTECSQSLIGSFSWLIHLRFSTHELQPHKTEFFANELQFIFQNYILHVWVPLKSSWFYYQVHSFEAKTSLTIIHIFCIHHVTNWVGLHEIIFCWKNLELDFPLTSLSPLTIYSLFSQAWESSNYIPHSVIKFYVPARKFCQI